MYQVVLHNDDHNSMEFVVLCLMRVFGHTADLAAKIMLEAHDRGRAIAEVEAEAEAKVHRDQLQSFGLSATVEKV
ncbi:MAG: ATP-dependent Clp protease adaptor ClpS [Lentisphaerae bacterium]|nr:ATP-dependent Clp protease adaptor ClpS [Lentisphaerota bacterium]